MSVLEQLIGKPLDQCTKQELEELVLKGRLAREAESTAAMGKKRAGGGRKKKDDGIPDLDLDLGDEFDSTPELDLDLAD